MPSIRDTAVVPASLLLILGAVACGGDDGGDDGAGTAASTGTNPTDGSSNTMPTSTVDDGPTTASPDSTAGPDGTDTNVDTTDSGMPACPYTPVDGMPDLALQQVANGFDRPVLAIGHPTELDRLFVVEQGGKIKILEPDATVAPEESFLDIEVACGDNTTIGCEQGLLGFTFHPDFPTDPRVYVSYVPNGDGEPLRVSEFTVMDGNPDQVDPGSERIVIDVGDIAGNHNGGMITFGTDGHLYISTGDGGNGDDQPQQTGRNTGVILAKILRIDPDPDGTPDMPIACSLCDMPGPFDYTIPADNPFVDNPDFAPEIYAWGFRNPWRYAWDMETNDLYVADVGQGDWEEVDIVVAGGDYGWSTMEGNHCFDGPCDESAAPGQTNADGMTAPIVEYSHGEGCSITGGAVYRSCEVPAWQGLYVYGDYCSGNLSALAWDGAAVESFGVVLDTGQNILGNGWNAYGDVFITTVQAIPNGPIEDGFVYRLAPS